MFNANQSSNPYLARVYANLLEGIMYSATKSGAMSHKRFPPNQSLSRKITDFPLKKNVPNLESSPIKLRDQFGTPTRFAPRQSFGFAPHFWAANLWLVLVSWAINSVEASMVCRKSHCFNIAWSWRRKKEYVWMIVWPFGRHSYQAIISWRSSSNANRFTLQDETNLSRIKTVLFFLWIRLHRWKLMFRWCYLASN